MTLHVRSSMFTSADIGSRHLDVPNIYLKHSRHEAKIKYWDITLNLYCRQFLFLK